VGLAVSWTNSWLTRGLERRSYFEPKSREEAVADRKLLLLKKTLLTKKKDEQVLHDQMNVHLLRLLYDVTVTFLSVICNQILTFGEFNSCELGVFRLALKWRCNRRWRTEQQRHYEQGTASKTSQSFLGGATCVLDIFARSGALSVEGVSQNVCLTAFRPSTGQAFCCWRSVVLPGNTCRAF